MILNVNKQEVQTLLNALEVYTEEINLREKLKRLQSTTKSPEPKQATDEQVKEYLNNLPK